VLVVLCGVCRSPEGPWATVALAAHPGGFTRHALVAPASADPQGFGARAGGVLRGSADVLSVHLADDAWVELRLRSLLRWPRRAFGALGPAHAVPGLAQYWHPVVLAAEARGEACLGGARVLFDGARAYAEKNWGPGFAGHWWWGQADSFADADAGVAFAGGRVKLAGGVVSPTAVVVRLGSRVLRLAPPLACVHAAAPPPARVHPAAPPPARAQAAAPAGAWRVRAFSFRHEVGIEGDGADGAPHVLPVPDVAARRVEMRSAQHLAGRVRLWVRGGGRTLVDVESPLGGLERGVPAHELSAAPPGGRRP
jgi:tocopherol cyclase